MVGPPGTNDHAVISAEVVSKISVVPLHDSAHFLFVGGMDSRGNSMNTTEILDVNTMSFEPGPVMRTGRVDCSAVALDE